MFINNDSFSFLYNEAEKYDLDLIRFNHYRDYDFSNIKAFIKKNNFDNCQYKTQPQLRNKIFIEEYYLLWGFLIKTDSYKKTIYKFWPIIINYKITFQEDFFMTSLIVVLSTRYKKLGFFGLFHLLHKDSTSKDFLSNEHYYLSMTIIAIFFYDYYIKKNPQDSIIIYNYIKFHSDRFLRLKIMNPDIFNIFIRKLFLDKNTSFRLKKNLITDLNLTKIELNNIFIDEELKNKKIKKKIKSIMDFQYSLINQNNLRTNFGNPKISIIIILSQFKHISKTIKSIMNQNFLDVEIILIYNNYNNTDLNLLNNYIKNFTNVKLINNRNKKGFIYSIVKGVLSSIGKYILILKPKYTLTHKTVLKDLYDEIIKEDIDILEFNLLIKINYYLDLKNTHFLLYKCNHFKSKLDLDNFKYNKEINHFDIQKEKLFNKIIKAELFKKIINKYKFNSINENMFNYHHEIFLFALENEKIRFKHVNDIGLIKYIKRSDLINKSKRIETLYKDSLFYINFLFDNSRKSIRAKKVALNNYFDKLSLIYNKFNNVTKQAINLYYKFINSKFIDKSDKNLLNFYFNSLIN